jgi:hypothetical protein
MPFILHLAKARWPEENEDYLRVTVIPLRQT